MYEIFLPKSEVMLGGVRLVSEICGEKYLQIIRQFQLVQGCLQTYSVELSASIIFLVEERVIKRAATTKKEK